jgi:vacuolar-type H+-ATPase subunit H
VRLDGWGETRTDWRNMAAVEQLDKRVERAREKNRRAVRYARQRSATLHREAELSDQAIRRALKSLRRAGLLT